MERKKALAFAAAVTGVLGSTTVAVAAVGGVSLLGFGGRQAQAGPLTTTQQSALAGARVITRTKDVYDRITVQAAVKSARARSAAYAAPVAPPAAPVPGASSAPRVIRPQPAPAKPHRRRASAPEKAAPRPVPRSATPTPTPAPVPTTTTEPDEHASPTPTVPPVTTTTRPRGVPKDWPPGKPIPPMPPNCSDPQLEDNGVWNCQDD